MPTATKNKTAPKAKAASRPGVNANAKTYAWSFGNEAEITKALTPFQLNGLQKAIDVLNTAGIKVQVTYPKMGKGKTSLS